MPHPIDLERRALLVDLVQEAGFEPVVAGGLAEARRFQRGAPGYGPSGNAAELRQKLRSAP